MAIVGYTRERPERESNVWSNAEATCDLESTKKERKKRVKGRSYATIKVGQKCNFYLRLEIITMIFSISRDY